MFTLKTGRLEVMSIVLTGTFKTSYMGMVFLLIPPFFSFAIFSSVKISRFSSSVPSNDLIILQLEF